MRGGALGGASAEVDGDEDNDGQGLWQAGKDGDEDNDGQGLWQVGKVEDAGVRPGTLVGWQSRG